MKLKIERLQVILKTVERCNIACKYCYYFFAGDDSFSRRPPLISKNVINSTVDFLFSAINDIDIEEIQIVFHGGEPLLQKKKYFDYMCNAFQERLSTVTKLNFSVQTNGMLIDDEWISLFEKYDVSVGISLDGLQKENDENRIDHNGRGTYTRVVSGIEKIVNAHQNGKLRQAPTLLTVINHKSDYKDIINHFHYDLKTNRVGVLLPDMSHDHDFPEGANAKDYGKALINIFDEVVDNEKIYVREVDDAINFFQKQKMSMVGEGKLLELEKFIQNGGRFIKNQIIVIQSDGDISLDDSFIPALKWKMSQDTYSINTTSLKKYLSLPIFDEIYQAYKNLPKKCTECVWVKICNGGDLENRYKDGNGFDQSSVFCDGLSDYYRHVTEYLFTNGYPKEIILEKLGIPS